MNLVKKVLETKVSCNNHTIHVDGSFQYCNTILSDSNTINLLYMVAIIYNLSWKYVPSDKTLFLNYNESLLVA